MATQKLSELLDAGHVVLNLEATEVTTLLEQMATQLVQAGRLPDSCGSRLSEALLQREDIGSTAVGMGVALPHAYVVDVPEAILMIARLAHPIAYAGAPDGQPVDLVFLLTGPATAQRNHVKVLAKVVRLVHDASWVKALRGAQTSLEVIDSVRAVEARHA